MVFRKILAMLPVVCIIMFTVGMTAGNKHSGLLLAPDSGMSYEEEYKMFEEDNSDHTDHLSRHKRFIYLNVDTNMAIALLVGIPLTFVLPSMTNLFSSWRKKRSIDDSSMNSWNFQDHPVAKPDMDKVYTYFQLLDIPELPCQLRAVCEFSAEPDKFYPLSDVILKRIRNPDLPALMYFEGKNHQANVSTNYSMLFDTASSPKTDSHPHQHTTTLYDLYNQAADEGQDYGYDKCQKQFEPSCHYPIEKLLNMPVIRFWNALQTILKLSFKDVPVK